MAIFEEKARYQLKSGCISSLSTPDVYMFSWMIRTQVGLLTCQVPSVIVQSATACLSSQSNMLSFFVFFFKLSYYVSKSRYICCISKQQRLHQWESHLQPRKRFSKSRRLPLRTLRWVHSITWVQPKYNIFMSSYPVDFCTMFQVFSGLVCFDFVPHLDSWKDKTSCSKYVFFILLFTISSPVLGCFHRNLIFPHNILPP